MNLTDLITHVPNTAALVAEIGQVAPDAVDLSDTKNPVWRSVVGLAPYAASAKGSTVRNSISGETVAHVRVGPDELAIIQLLTSITILASTPYTGNADTTAANLYSALAADTASQAVYDATYDQTPYQVSDGNGGTITITPPPRIPGVA